MIFSYVLSNYAENKTYYTAQTKRVSLFFAKQPKEVKEFWEDYIPPYKNLGAIFIKAYNKKTEPE